MESETNSTEMQHTAEGRIESLIARLVAVVELLERAVPRTEIAASALAAQAIGPIVAMVEGGSREAELARKLADAEKTIAQLRAQTSVQSSAQSSVQSSVQSSAQPASREGRRTLPVTLLAKQDGSAPEPGALDAALASLSLEQRMAVKAQLLRSGVV